MKGLKTVKKFFGTMRINHSSSNIINDDFHYIYRIHKNNFVGSGEICEDLKNALCKISGKLYVHLVNSGSAALFTVLESLKENSGDKKEIVTSGYSCSAIVNTIFQAGLQPIFADINSYDLNFNIESVKKLISKSTLAIIAPSIGGIPININELEKMDIPVINDCCQALGTTISGRDYTSQGETAILSFGSTKIISGGIGGAILTNNNNLFNIVQYKCQYEKPIVSYQKNGFEIGYNANLSDLNAGLILSQIKRLRDILEKRQSIAMAYDNAMVNKNVQIVEEIESIRFNRYRYFFFTDNACWIQSCFNKQNIDARISIGHNLASYFGKNCLENIHNLSHKVVSLPIYPSLTDAEITKICGIIDEI